MKCIRKKKMKDIEKKTEKKETDDEEMEDLTLVPERDPEYDEA